MSKFLNSWINIYPHDWEFSLYDFYTFSIDFVKYSKYYRRIFAFFSTLTRSSSKTNRLNIDFIIFFYVSKFTVFSVSSLDLNGEFINFEAFFFVLTLFPTQFGRYQKWVSIHPDVHSYTHNVVTHHIHAPQAYPPKKKLLFNLLLNEIYVCCCVIK